MAPAKAGSARELKRAGLGHRSEVLSFGTDCLQAQSELEKRFHERGHPSIEEVDVTVSRIRVQLRIMTSGQTLQSTARVANLLVSRSPIELLLLHRDLKADVGKVFLSVLVTEDKHP